MIPQTANRTQVAKSSWNIKYKLNATLRHGTNGTIGTSNIGFTSETGCLQMIMISTKVEAPTTNKALKTNTSLSLLSIKCRTMHNIIEHKENKTIANFVIVDDKRLACLAPFKFSSCLST